MLILLHFHNGFTVNHAYHLPHYLDILACNLSYIYDKYQMIEETRSQAIIPDLTSVADYAGLLLVVI